MFRSQHPTRFPSSRASEPLRLSQKSLPLTKLHHHHFYLPRHTGIMKISLSFKNKSVTSINHEKQLVNRLQGWGLCQSRGWTKLELTSRFISTITLTVWGDTVTEAGVAFILHCLYLCLGSVATIRQRSSPMLLWDPWEYLRKDKAQEKKQFPSNILSFLAKQLQWRKYLSLPLWQRMTRIESKLPHTQWENNTIKKPQWPSNPWERVQISISLVKLPRKAPNQTEGYLIPLHFKWVLLHVQWNGSYIWRRLNYKEFYKQKAFW